MSKRIDEALQLVLNATEYVTDVKFTLKDLRGEWRKTELVSCRIVCCYLLKHNTKMTLNAIASHLGYKNHTSPLHAIKIYKSARGEELKLYNEITNRCQVDFADVVQSVISDYARTNAELIKLISTEVQNTESIKVFSCNLITKLEGLITDDKVLEGWRRTIIQKELEDSRLLIRNFNGAKG